MAWSVTSSDANVPATGGQTMHQIHNNSDQKMMFKVKLSNTHDYRVSLIFGFVDALSNANIEVIRRAERRGMTVWCCNSSQRLKTPPTPELHLEMGKMCPVRTCSSSISMPHR
ncbi:unnamed protein product [Heligmosomoides polygyrus]|uniref:MSP domain-containing protein n=1 Tax=Heligmosomoides polygyrus TaxID=6339 RepID=A0A183FJ20_HELPZ|nr:unnamed protein product [Heligmosomoides polygyrus]